MASSLTSVLSVSLLVVGLLRPAPAAAAAGRFVSRPADVWDVVPQAAVGGPEAQATPARPRTIPFFAGSFTTDGQVFAYRMVGTNPQRPRRTVVPVVIVPIRFQFADGSHFDPAGTIARLRRSPLFRKASFGSDFTQYGDAFQRAEFAAPPGYHVLLGRPSVTKTAVVDVPAGQGGTRGTAAGGVVGVLNDRYFAERVVPDLVNHMRLPPTKLIVFWSSAVLFAEPGTSAVILGEHSAGVDRTGTAIWTWVWASWHTPMTAPEGETDVAALSHEIAEWYANPFGGNTAPDWQATFYPCNASLEVGDPLVGVTRLVNGSHLQDEAFLSWFAHQVPSTAAGGLYSFFGTLTAPATACTPGGG